MAKFKAGDKVVLSKLIYAACSGLKWFKRAEEIVRDDGFLVVSEVCEFSEQCIYLMEGIPFILFSEEWLEPYSPNIEQGPLTLLTEDGLSVRDHFAMAALMCFRADLFTAPEYVAEKAYKVADAMMEARKI